MTYTYKAFISYRHAPLDMRVAGEIQNRLERYPIPGSIRREQGIRSIGRIFRDKDELPSTSDLNENIKTALASSEYLICICSPDYMGSVWCRKELEFFLESHDKAHVLTVLADGDPSQVVPEILRTETVSVTEEDGSVSEREIALEPLSCDYRIDRHRARTEELPRLAAALVGCRYADLRQKLRRRRMRLTAAAAAAGALLLVYFVWSYMGIRRNYRTALINQSRYLAASAQEALNGNDNLLAAQLSLAALPDEQTDRPIVPEALNTLSRAVGAYQSSAVLNFRSTASYEVPGGGLSRHLLSPKAQYLAMMDLSGSVLAVWDLKEDAMTAQVNSLDLIGANYGVCISGYDEEQFLLWNDYGKTVALVRYGEGSAAWRQDFEFGGWILDLVSTGETQDALLMLLSEKDLLFIDAETGEVCARMNVSNASGGQASQWYNQNGGTRVGDEGLYALCPGAGCVCVAAGVPYEESRGSGSDTTDITGFFTYYYRTGRSVWTPFERSCWKAEGLSRDEKGRILLACTDTPDDYVINTLEQSSRSIHTASGSYLRGRETVLLLEETTGETLWTNELHYQGPRSLKTETAAYAGVPYVYQDLRILPGNEDHPDREVAVAATSNVIALYDTESGKTVREVTLPDEIVSVDPQLPGENVVRVNGRGGTQYYFRYYQDHYSAMRFMSEDMDDAAFFRGSISAGTYTRFIVRQAETIRVFQAQSGDDDWQRYDCTVPGEISDSCICGNTLLLLDDQSRLYAYDLQTRTDLWQAAIPETGNYDIRGISENGTYVLLRRGYAPYYLRVTMADGTIEQVSILDSGHLTGAGRWHFDEYHAAVKGGHLYYKATNYDRHKSFWFRYSMEDGSVTHVTMPYYADSSKTDESVHFFTDNGAKGLIAENGIGCLVDFEKGEVTVYDDPVPDATKGAFNEDGSMFALWDSDERILRVFTEDGREAWEVSDQREEYIDRIWFYKGDLFTATENCHLYRYNAADGRPYGVLTTSFVIDPGQAGSPPCSDLGDGRILIGSGSGNGALLMVDLDDWAITGEAQGVLGYCAGTGQVISIGDDGQSPALGSCPCYSPQQLIDKGRRYVGDHTLSEEEKRRYGLD